MLNIVFFPFCCYYANVRSYGFIVSFPQALVRAGEQAAVSTGEDATLARLQLDEIKAAISSSERDLNKLNRFMFRIS